MVAAPDPAGGQEPAGTTLRRLWECPDCGLRQVVPALRPGTAAHCLRCNRLLRRARHEPLGRALALNLAALVLIGVACLMPLMTVSAGGMDLSANLFSGPKNLRSDGLWELSAVVLFTSVAAPVVKVLAMTYVLGGLQSRRPWRHLRQVFAWIEWLRPWSMVEVYLLGVFVAYVKLIDLVHIELGPAIYALGALMLTMVAADAVLDRQAVWEALDRQEADPARASWESPGLMPEPMVGAIACEVCGLLGQPDPDWPAHCLRCGARLHHRKPNSMARAWALMIAAVIFYGPANFYPVLTVIQLGSGAPSTIMGGVVELLASGMLPLAALVFCASVVIPVLKLIALGAMLVATRLGSARWLRDRTRAYRIVAAIGRWSMIDVFMASILVALVHFGGLVNIRSGFGAVAFASVVILTMLAAEAFDPRLMWDAAGAQEEAMA
ncbi:paraquat-inducible protein A [Paracraurococcus lichenis]|uniref:Paraquat-inducible protein A n=1 Tax=Paracraurococcus lichenis TaxID=3064888 RepID=A0ABT9EDM7_9PROT|nr:paraquat-inducible protein A [Paracraurococcus sp. LOR1-02]MDO9714176.1 paraquat-inducible protein A [Paracraurococcus sp. LOR1-02]